MIRLFLPLLLVMPLAAILLPVGAAETPESVDLRPLIDETAIRSGDLIFRRGRSWLSRAVVEADPASDFSHVGIAVIDARGVFVVHATPGGEGLPAGVLSEPLAAFLAPRAARGVAIRRVSDVVAARKAADLARSWALESRRFDDEFLAGYDAASEGALYCTELVWKAYLHAGIDLLDGRLDVLELPLGPDRYVLPSSLMSAAHTTELQRQPKSGRDS